MRNAIPIPRQEMAVMGWFQVSGFRCQKQDRYPVSGVRGHGEQAR